VEYSQLCEAVSCALARIFSISSGVIIWTCRVMVKASVQAAVCEVLR
jgi:hypothetical protein